MKHTVVSSKNADLDVKDVGVKLKKHNRQLSRSLKTLEYIYVIEINYEEKHEMNRFEELLKFKTKIQKHIIKTTQKINYYKSLQNKLKY
ncbi:hypothetical protein [Flavivirga rizhaonensis]|uniref:Uncharacterized protein n=1 Tax=Flavivirga rizhaonensis TaxID=2559571 RepID=A0A4S1E1Z3_9FLAO|nr:hypothetical protein [Flavivirga rizhaonensis]TGV04636.1 hypothetical protein EM932_00480 [Flavivirga rizhaonensis]